MPENPSTWEVVLGDQKFKDTFSLTVSRKTIKHPEENKQKPNQTKPPQYEVWKGFFIYYNEDYNENIGKVADYGRL